MIKLIAMALALFSTAVTSVEANWKDDIRGEGGYKVTPKDNALKPFTLGFAAYRKTIGITLTGVSDVEFSGVALSTGYGISNHIGIGAVFFSLESETNSILSTTQSDGYDLMLNFGTGHVTDGLKAYGGIGLFKDKWSDTNYLGSLSFSGIQIGGGLGYNWENISLGAAINLRKASEYREFMDAYIIRSGNSLSGESGYGYVMSSTLTLSVRF